MEIGFLTSNDTIGMVSAWPVSGTNYVLKV
jgi:hypothetical protein